ncbi:zinc finger protein 652-A-like [Spodoptera frugiperda]|uniref:SFRICE_012583 n=1 Tax=Spodoptera frugiperda TaxID=7108 RepID=A0A2H1V5G6_SPOFR|nr:zinc finger protein 652-A-like [Spodoptera frugiperda]
MMEMETDPLEGSSYEVGVTVKTEIKEESEDDHYNTMALLELAQCVQTNQEPIEFNSTDAMMDPKTGLMICLHCLEDFDSSLLSDHMMTAHNYRRVLFKCQLCQSTFQERKLLNIHRQECQPEQKVRKRKTFQQILRDVEAKYYVGDQQALLEPVSCPICLLELPKYCLKEHLLNEHRKPDVILTCGRCNRNFKSKLTLREHVKLVHEAVEDSEECELCGQKFRSLKYLSNHKRNVHPSGNKIHKCMVCGKEFKSRLCLHQHSKYVHPPESASVECPHCPNKIFKSRMNLTQHLKVSHGYKRKLSSIPTM